MFQLIQKHKYSFLLTINISILLLEWTFAPHCSGVRWEHFQNQIPGPGHGDTFGVHMKWESGSLLMGDLSAARVETLLITFSAGASHPKALLAFPESFQIPRSPESWLYLLQPGMWPCPVSLPDHNYLAPTLFLAFAMISADSVQNWTPESSGYCLLKVVLAGMEHYKPHYSSKSLSSSSVPGSI